MIPNTKTSSSQISIRQESQTTKKFTLQLQPYWLLQFLKSGVNTGKIKSAPSFSC